MAKPKLRSLNPMDFTKLTPNRQEVIAKASANPLPLADSYKPNQIANALHPKKQHLVVNEIIEHSNDMKTYVFGPDATKGTNALAYFSAGQYISINVDVNGMPLTRPYSLSSSPKEALDGKYMLTIKRVDGGLATNYILDNWTVGQSVVSSEPLGHLTYEPLRDAKTVIGIAGGSGITPFYSLAKAIAEGSEDFNLVLLYGSRTLSDALFSDEIKAIAATCDKVKLINVLSDEEKEGCEKGFITAELIKKYAPEVYSIFMCGPQAMYNFVDKEIETLNLRRKFVRHELFGEYFNPAKESDYPSNVAPEFNITVRIAGKESVIKASSDESILRSLEKNGIAAPAHCRSGECGWCHSRLVSGDVYTPKSIDGRREADLIYGYIHPCATFPLSDLVIEVPPIAK